MQVKLEQNLYWCPCSTPFRTLSDLDSHALHTHFGSPDEDLPEGSSTPISQPPALPPQSVVEIGDFPPMRRRCAVTSGGHTSFPAYHAAVLAQNGLVLHHTASLVCIECRAGIHINNVSTHAINIHGRTRSSTGKVELSHVLSSLRNNGLLAVFNKSQPPRPNVDPVLGVCRYQEDLAPPVGGFRCTYPACNVAFRAVGNTSSHDLEHDGQHKTTLQPCHMQTVFPAPRAHFFPIHLKSDHAPASPSDKLTHLQESLAIADRLNAMTPESIHRNGSWREKGLVLTMTRWHRSLEPVASSPKLLKSVEHIRELPLMGSTDTYYAYVRTCYASLQRNTTANAQDEMDVSFPYRILRILQ
jgi:hypothetical protein